MEWSRVKGEGRGGRAARGGKGKGDKRGESIEEWNGVG